ncbi:PPOX class probable F420-dependent enzyme [Ilumatobacter fluminis]|uniref:PPOX class probable F420-dependent enzyme n=1 Tax=Ilumatobacter fluminis TaxID=467091 RepID=A0A4R7I5L0_9ACTN|nr:TIGR03618 family F420-dependent PPOX class oxidoreductase [Ilumatobacter fluminis]TDT17983.1 PPOX class probable F420-dependent enzyme [Ilumatobacter fluminis]
MAYTVNDPSRTAGSPIPITSLPFRGLGGQPPFEPDDLDRFLRAPRIANLAYVRKDGRTNQAPLWYGYDEGVVHFTMEANSAKHRALVRDPRVTVTVQDERPPYRAVIVDGTVTIDDLGDDTAPSMSLAERYFGKVAAAKYRSMYEDVRKDAGMVRVTLHPDEVKGFDNTNAVDPVTLAFVRVRNRLPVPRRWL